MVIVSTHLDAADSLIGFKISCLTVSQTVPDGPRASMDDLVDGRKVGSDMKCSVGDHLA